MNVFNSNNKKLLYILRLSPLTMQIILSLLRENVGQNTWNCLGFNPFSFLHKWHSTGLISPESEYTSCFMSLGSYRNKAKKTLASLKVKIEHPQKSIDSCARKMQKKWLQNISLKKLIYLILQICLTFFAQICR